MANQANLDFKLKATDTVPIRFFAVPSREMPAVRGRPGYKVLQWETLPLISGSEQSVYSVRHYIDRVKPVVAVGAVQGTPPTSRYVYGLTIPNISGSVATPGSSPVFSVIGVIDATVTISVKGSVSPDQKAQAEFISEQLLSLLAKPSFVDGVVYF